MRWHGFIQVSATSAVPRDDAPAQDSRQDSGYHGRHVARSAADEASFRAAFAWEQQAPHREVDDLRFFASPRAGSLISRAKAFCRCDATCE